MPQFKQPPYWLEVKKEYITANFDNLCKYLKAYRYIEDQESVESDFNKTFHCLKEVVYDYFEQAKESSLIKKPSKVIKMELWFAVKLIATYILTCFEKKNTTDYHAIINLANILILEEKVPENTKEAIKDLIINCICKKTICKLNYSWNNIELIKTNESLSTMAVFLSKIEFNENVDYEFKFEGKGLILLDKTGLHAAAMNYRAYKILSNPNVMHLPYNIDIKDDSKTTYNSFSKLHDIIKSIEYKQNAVKPTSTNLTEEINNDDDILVRVDKIFSDVIHVSAIKSSNCHSSGRLEIKVKNRYNLNGCFEKHLLEGDYLKVKNQSKGVYKFRLNDTFDVFYEKYMYGFVDSCCKAMFIKKNNEGNQFLTEDGILVNVKHDENTDNEISEYEKPFVHEIYINNISKDLNDNLIAYGDITDKGESTDKDFKTNAQKKIIRKFIESCMPGNKEQESSKGDIQKDDVNCLARSIYQLAISLQQTEEKYKMLHVVYMLFKLTENEKEKHYIKFNKRYIYCLAKFAQGENPKELKLEHDDSLELTHSMLEKIETIKKLNKYIVNQEIIIDPNKNIEDKDLLDNLINASNTLIDKINPTEIERIKKKIAFNLGVSDIYVDTVNKDNNYGEEGVKLEFKTSFVYPPNNNATPDLRVQKYNVLKTICGMLNNQGGDVLLGVNDYGYARGLDDDIKELYNKKFIPEDTYDKLRLFISHEIDKAFINFDKTESGKQITDELVECNIEGDPKIT